MTSLQSPMTVGNNGRKEVANRLQAMCDRGFTRKCPAKMTNNFDTMKLLFTITWLSFEMTVTISSISMVKTLVVDGDDRETLSTVQPIHKLLYYYC